MEKKYPIGELIEKLKENIRNHMNPYNLGDEGETSRLIFQLIQIAEKQAPTGAIWVKADQKPEHNVGVLVFIPGEDNHITSGMWDISNEWVLLDEYRTPDEEVTHWTALPAFPEGYTHDDISEEWVSTLKAIAKEELAKKGIARANDWISVEDHLPEIAEYVMIYNTERATLIGRLMSNGWVAMFADGENFMGVLTATHWRPLPEAPKK
jgi:hypothetical protein